MKPKKVNVDKIKKVIVIALALTIFYTVYFQYIGNPISQEFISWEQSGSEVSTGKIGVQTTLNLNIYSNSLLGYKGTATIKIKKDIPILSDPILISKSVPINLGYGTGKKQSVSIQFTPNENAGGTLDKIREYYYEIYTDGDRSVYKPEISGDRNGLTIGNKASGGTVPTVTSILFNGQPQISVAPGTGITTKIHMTGKGQGTLKVEIRKDYSLIPDGETYTEFSKEVTLDGSTIITIPTWIAQSQGSTFREYFARISWNGEYIYDPESPSEREYVKLSSSSSGSGGTVTPTGKIEYKSVEWSNNNARIFFTITGTWSGNVNAQVKKDVTGSDQLLNSVNKQLSGTDTEVYIDIPFTASNGDWVFIKVPNIYDEDGTGGIFGGTSQRQEDGTEIQITQSTPPFSSPTPTTTPTSGTSPTPTPSQNAVVSYDKVELKSNYGSGTRINVPQGTQVDVYLTVTSSASTSGTLSIEVRKDNLWPTDDIAHTTLSKQTNLNSGVNTVLVGSFTATDLSNTNSFRQYFFKPSWNTQLLNDPTNPDTREAVTTYYTSTPPTNPSPGQTPTQGTLQILKIGFGNPAKDTITVNNGDTVQVYAYLKAVNGNAQGTVKIDIRKDYIGKIDETVSTIQNSVSLNSGETKYVSIGSFTTDTSTSPPNWFSGTRQYFGRAYLNNVLVYDPTDPNTRPHVEVN